MICTAYRIVPVGEIKGIKWEGHVASTVGTAIKEI